MNEQFVRTCVELTERAVNGSWRGILDNDVKESLIQVLLGKGSDADYVNINRVGITITKVKL